MRRYKHNLAVGLLAALCFAGTALAAEKPDFTGEWKLNIAKSDFGQMPAPSSSVSKIDHKDPSLKIVTTAAYDQGERTMENVYSTDGKETTNKGFGDSEVKSTAKWDGPALLIESKANFNGNDFTIKAKWTLSEGGKTLTMVRNFTSSQGEGTQTQVLEKK